MLKFNSILKTQNIDSIEIDLIPKIFYEINYIDNIAFPLLKNLN